MKTVHKSKVHTDRPTYADFDAPHKFEAIKSIIAKRLIEHPNAICSYSGGSDSDIMLHLIETVRKGFDLPPIQYCFFDTGLEMEAIKRHVRETAERYGVTITEYKAGQKDPNNPKKRIGKNIVIAVRDHGLPFISKIVSQALEGVQRKSIPLSIAAEYEDAENKMAKRVELRKRYPACEQEINFLCSCDSAGNPIPGSQASINSKKYLLDFLEENPIPFRVSDKCCKYCKKHLANAAQKDFDMIITGERIAEGGPRSMIHTSATCFTETADGQYRLRPLYYATDADKQWYKDYYNIRYSDAYEVYGLNRTGCCGCSISAKAVEDLEKIRPYEPNLVKAAWYVFGDSYRYRHRYNAYKATKQAQSKKRANQCDGQTGFLEDAT